MLRCERYILSCQFHLDCCVSDILSCCQFHLDFAVKVISEDETVMTSAKASHLLMRLRPVSTGGDMSTAKVITFVPDTRKKGASEGHFLFTYVNLIWNLM